MFLKLILMIFTKGKRIMNVNVKSMFGDDAMIDHVAIAVKDLEAAIALYENVFCFKLLKRREIDGAFSGMISAEFEVGTFSLVLVQGTSEQSQVTQYVKTYGSGAQHVAVKVDNLENIAKKLADNGVEFATDIIRGKGLIQIFTKRDENTGMMFELIQREPEQSGFLKTNIQELFNQLEKSGAC